MRFPEIKKNFGFGLMRLPMTGDTVDTDQVSKMVDAFLEAGFNYFDTAHPYLNGLSEDAVKTCLSSRHPRENFLLADKLSFNCFETEADILPLFYRQLEKCGVEYFDFYLMHAMNLERNQKYASCNAFEIVQELKKQGRIRHVGMSFHDSAANLDKLLTEHPEMEFVQLQVNYVDMEDQRVQARKCLEVCRRHGKPVIVMEPVKGGSLVNLPEEARAMMTDFSPAGYALRFAASQEGVMMVLSGMSDEVQMRDNLASMGNFVPLSAEENEMIRKVCTVYQAQNKIPCTACRYCVDGCPAGVPIPEIFHAMNEKQKEAYAGFGVQADACVGCGQCEEECPQHLQIRSLLEKAHEALC